MKRNFICLVMFLVATFALAQNNPWNEKTRDAAYEAPNSLLQKKWFEEAENTTWIFSANGALKTIKEYNPDNVRINLTITAKYTRNKDQLTITYTGAKATCNQSDLAGMSARARDTFLGQLKQIEQNIYSTIKNQVLHFLILRLDKECMLITEYEPNLKLFDGTKWTTLSTIK